MLPHIGFPSCQESASILPMDIDIDAAGDPFMGSIAL